MSSLLTVIIGVFDGPHAVLFVTSTVPGYTPRKGALLTSGINPLPGGNGPNMANNSATERTRAQGRAKCPNPSRSDTKPPARLEHAFIPVSLASKTWAPGRLILINCSETGRKCTSGHPIIAESARKGGTSF